MSKIEWTYMTVNPIKPVINGQLQGNYCVKVSEGCKNCYAERLNKNPFFLGNGLSYKVMKGNAPEMALDHAKCRKWARMKSRKKIFVCDMTDIFLEIIPNEVIFQLLDYMLAAPKQVFQILTKRAARMNTVIWKYCLHKDISRLPQHIWVGVSAENHLRFDERINHLLTAMVSMRFLSLEPLIGPIYNKIDLLFPCIDWIIIGGESGPGARPMAPDWAMHIITNAANIPIFFKQWGAYRPFDPKKDEPKKLVELPNNAGSMIKVNKKLAGNKINGRTYQAFPHTQNMMPCT